ncbi:SsgA family sporulation/cell division regulator [Kitasatospora sp. A2-31]|uniref:SsgA family sporulation/cell division regulator n=1 Tax=Kitasatospora sp. A2-31 TaxID=2916414 RepID=UPI001EEC6AC7|nr:SsgA family sporulation/cell division regulator [Kitasatospora sp. A2-31]MCG6495279.1 SsgA family sporulation/cell division regulator [Kitasatospora sp. A2-31]
MTDRETPRVPPQRSGAESAVMDLDLRTVVSPGLSILVRARLRYHRAEPYAVYLDSHVDRDEPITWMFARELLAAGLEGWAGVGDVSVHPGVGGEAGTVFIALGGDESSVVLRARAAEVRTFLGRTECVVPYGREREFVDLDVLLRRLLEAGPPEA